MSLRDTSWIYNPSDTANPIKTANATVEQINQTQNVVQVRSGVYNITYKQRITNTLYKWHGLSASAVTSFMNTRNADPQDSRDYQVTRQNNVMQAYYITANVKSVGEFVFDKIEIDT